MHHIQKCILLAARLCNGRVILLVLTLETLNCLQLKLGFAFDKLWICSVFILEIKRCFRWILLEHRVERS